MSGLQFKAQSILNQSFRPRYLVLTPEIHSILLLKSEATEKFVERSDSLAVTIHARIPNALQLKHENFIMFTVHTSLTEPL